MSDPSLGLEISHGYGIAFDQCEECLSGLFNAEWLRRRKSRVTMADGAEAVCVVFEVDLCEVLVGAWHGRQGPW